MLNAPAIPSDAALDAMQLRADPLADRTIAAILDPWPDGEVPPPDAEPWRRIASVNRLLAQWTDNAALTHWQAAGAPDPRVAGPLQDYVQAGRSLPDWADPARIERAEVLFMEYGALSCMLLFCASLPECYVIPDLSSVLHTAGQLEQHTEHRIRSTAAMIFPVMLHGGLTRPDGAGIAQVLKVRLIHATIRHLILRGAPGAAVQVPPLDLAQSAGPPGLYETLLACGWDVERDGLPCNQEELAYTLLTFGYVFLRSLRRLGIGLCPQDEAAYLHAWNVVGHVLGIDRALMVDDMDAGAALLERMQQRGRDHVPRPDARPGLGQALMHTMEQALPWRVARPFPRLMTRYLCGRATAGDLGLDRQRAPLASRALFWLILGTARAIDTVARTVWPDFSLSRSLSRVLGYHFMSTVLMDQTRPLRLPDRLLDQMGRMLGHWSDDPKAPAWLNRLEDRLTTQGSWNPEARQAAPQPDTSAGHG